MKQNELNLIKYVIDLLNKNNNYDNHTYEAIELLETLKEVE
jgi:hypothetical protein